jgi:hypothetical protein
MSANRSVQAAQRRRAGPPEPNVPARGPQPSINSAQMFANQARGGANLNTQPGRLAAQQMNVQQQQQMNQMSQQQAQQQQQQSIGNINKMTVAQAITLITLRLGSLETKLMTLELGQEGMSLGNMENNENIVVMDKDVINSILSRLDMVEKQVVTGGSVSNNNDITLFKQQLETIKQSIIQNRTYTNTLVKENKDLKIELEGLRGELNFTKELLESIQSLAMDNSQKILSISLLGGDIDFNIQDTLEKGDLSDNSLYIGEYEDELDDNFEEQEVIQNEIIGSNLKEIIENEINTNPVVNSTPVYSSI